MSDGEWWCPECKEVVHPMQVTYTERHGVCGHAVEWVVDAKAQDEIRRLTKENERLKAQNDEEFERGADIHIENRREIRRLQKEIERLREALILIRDRNTSLPQYMVDAGKIAREALKEAGDE